MSVVTSSWFSVTWATALWTLKYLDETVNMSKRSTRTPLLPQGYVKSGFEPVWEAFKQSLDSGMEKGGSFAAYHQGELVINMWGGWADREALRLWRKDTAGVFFSMTKSLSSVVIAQLVDRGLLEYEDKISKHWPEFAQNGKGDITLQTYISNKSGLAELTEPYHMSWLRDDPSHLGDVLARATPLWKPDLDLHIGMPKHLQYRVARLNIDLQQHKTYKQQHSGDPDIFKLTLKNPIELRKGEDKPRCVGCDEDLTVKHILLDCVDFATQRADFYSSPNLKHLFTQTHVIHDPYILELPNGSTHGVGTAAAMAKFHSILAKGQDDSGRRIISHVATERMQVPLSWGVDKTYGGTDIYSLGLCLLPVVEAKKVHYLFGHSGLGWQMAAADSKHQVGFCYVTNFLIPGSDSKWLHLYNKLFECVLRVEGSNVERKTYKGFSNDIPPPSKL